MLRILYNLHKALYINLLLDFFVFTPKNRIFLIVCLFFSLIFIYLPKNLLIFSGFDVIINCSQFMAHDEK